MPEGRYGKMLPNPNYIPIHLEYALKTLKFFVNQKISEVLSGVPLHFSSTDLKEIPTPIRMGMDGDGLGWYNPSYPLVT